MSSINNTASGNASLSINTATISAANSSYNLANSLSNNFIISGSYYNNLDYIIRELIGNEEISETTIRSVIMDMKTAGKDEAIDFNGLLTTRSLSEKFLNDFYDKFNKGELYRHQSVSLDFIKKHLSDIKDNEDACREISFHQALTEEFIELFAEHINWAALAANTKVKFTVSFLLKYIDKFDDLALKSLCQNDAINTGVFNAFLEVVPDDVRYRLDWEAISWHKDLTEENILNNLDFIDFNSLLLATRKFKDDVITCFRKVKFGI